MDYLFPLSNLQLSFKIVPDTSYNHFHNILRLFDVLPNFPFTTSETMRCITTKHGLHELRHELPNDLRVRSKEFRKYQASV